jgi:hypothetical protein
MIRHTVTESCQWLCAFFDAPFNLTMTAFSKQLSFRWSDLDQISMCDIVLITILVRNTVLSGRRRLWYGLTILFLEKNAFSEELKLSDVIFSLYNYF